MKIKIKKKINQTMIKKNQIYKYKKYNIKNFN